MTDRDELESRLTAAFEREANAITPSSRLAEIQAAVPRRRSWTTWGIPLAAAAAVAAIAVVAWVGLRPSPGGVATPATTVTAGPNLVSVPVPYYVVVPPAAANGHYALARRSIIGTVPEGSTQALVEFALNAAVNLPWGDDDNHAVHTFANGTTVGYLPAMTPEVGLQVSATGEPGLSPEVQQLAIQALVWTATDVLQQPAAAVSVTVNGGGPLFENVDGGVFKRPADDRLASELAPIWVDRPVVGQAHPPQDSVVVSGTACTFEQTFSWALTESTRVQRNGTVTAGAASCPSQRGPWSVDLGVLSAGTYQFTATIVSAETGQVSTTVVTSFTVR